MTFVLSIFKWQFNTGFTVYVISTEIPCADLNVCVWYGSYCNVVGMVVKHDLLSGQFSCKLDHSSPYPIYNLEDNISATNQQWHRYVT